SQADRLPVEEHVDAVTRPRAELGRQIVAEDDIAGYRGRSGVSQPRVPHRATELASGIEVEFVDERFGFGPALTVRRDGGCDGGGCRHLAGRPITPRQGRGGDS